jgi:hypothetical protein
MLLTSHAIEARAKARDRPSSHRLRESSEPIMSKRKSTGGTSFSQGPAIASHIGDHCARHDSERLDIFEQHAYHQNRRQHVHVLLMENGSMFAPVAGIKCLLQAMTTFRSAHALCVCAVFSGCILWHSVC